MIHYPCLLIYIFLSVVVTPIAARAQTQQALLQIHEIRAQVDIPLDDDENSELVTYLAPLLKKPADEKTKNSAIMLLQNLGRYKSTTCEYLNDNQTTTLLCHLVRIPVVRQIVIQNLPIILLERDLRKRLSVRTGESFDIDSVSGRAQIDRLRETTASFLERQGYYGAQVSVSHQSIDRTSTLDLVIDIQGGAFWMVRDVTLDDEITFDRDKITSRFRNMCRNFRYAFEGLGMQGFSCYSRDKEREVVKSLQIYLNEKGYSEASISIRRTPLDPSDSQTPKECRANDSEIAAYAERGLKAPTECLDLDISIDLGPKIDIEYVFVEAQTLSLAPVGLFFRSLFGIEFFSRLLNTSFVGKKWPADQTILTHELREALTFDSARKINEREISQSIENMKSVLAARGYPNADIQLEHETHADQVIHLRFTITPYRPYAVTKVRFIGTPVFSDEQILEDASLTVMPRSAFDTGHFDDSLLALDIDKLKSFYAAQGYPDAQIAVDKQYIEDEGVLLNYSIEPGKKYVVRALNIENGDVKILPQILPLLANCKNAKEADASLLSSTAICEGSPYLAHSLAEDENRVVEVYSANGYLYASAKAQATQTPEGAQIRVTLNPPSQNPQVKVAGVLVDGNTTTERYVLLRHIGNSLFSPGVPLNPPALEEGVAKLRRTNLYSRLSFSYLGSKERESKVYILLSVVEKPSLLFDLSLAFSTDNLFSVGGELKESNLFGTMLKLSTEVNLGLFWGRQSRFKNAFGWPSIFGLPLDFDLTIPLLAFENRPTRNPPERHFLAQIIASLKWQLTTAFAPFLKYEIRVDKWQQQYDPSSIDITQMIESLDGLVLVLKEPSSTRGIVTPGFSYVDVDHPFDPKKGLKVTLSVDLSQQFLGSQFPFQMLNIQVANYFTLGSFTFATQLVARRAFINDPRNQWWVLKYQSDMDTLGGDRSVRGYNLGSIGLWGASRNSRDGTILLDQNGGGTINGFHPGNLSLQGNFEIRFPLAKNFFIGDLNGAVFTDVGFVDVCTGLFECDDGTNYLTPAGQDRRLGWSVGVGLRYVLPVGPIALDYGISPIHSSTGFLGRESRIHLLFGYTF